FGGLCEGKNILIQGCVIVSAKRFSVNLVCANGDIAFHFNPRFDEGNIIVCNTQEKGCWGPEERTSTMLFQRGVSFQVIINIRSCGYQVSINGSQFIDYRHRLPMNLVQTLQIKGDVSLSCINFTGGFVSIPSPAMPTKPRPPGHAHRTGSKIFLNLTTVPRSHDPHFNPHTFLGYRFHVNLKNLLLGNIALHVNPRFKEGALVRNSFINGAWGSEERNVAFLPFCPGQAFQLEITYLENCYQVLVNGQLKFEYVHRIPPSQVDQLEIDGDVILSCVQY
uniref:Galectin n=1 Tax=Pseudonaja textilis TaxID=8673 RepID=A0A670ZY90_PSETE